MVSILTRIFTKTLFLATTLVASGTLHAETAPLASKLRATEVVEQALAAHGGLSAMQDAGGFDVRLEGTYDLSTRLQGRSPFSDEPTPIVERIVFDAGTKRVSYDVDLFNYYSSNQKLREIYDDQRRMIYIDKRNGDAGWVPIQTVPDSRERLTRVLPGVLLGEALGRAQSLRYVGQDEVDGRAFDVVSFSSINGDILTLSVERETRLLHSLKSVIDMPLLGQVEMSWQWLDYEEQGSVGVIPRRLQVTLANRVLKDVSLATDFGTFQDAFDAPEGTEIGDPPDDLRMLADFVPHSQRPPEIEPIAPNVYLVNNLRPGFSLLFVEFDEFVVAVDAPTGWYEMNQIPPMNWSHGDSVHALGEKYLAAVALAVPDKPVRHVVLTHHHSDHIGGFLPFVDAGANVVAGESAAHMARTAFNARVMASAGRDSEEPELTIQVVNGEKVITDGKTEMRLIELPDGNPKAENYLMVYLPAQKLLYATGFVYPVPEAVFPLKESVPLSIYFVDWLDSSGLDVDTIYNVHAMRKVEDWQLDTIREIRERNK